MIKKLICTLILLISTIATAATLSTDPVLKLVPPPTTVEYNINGGEWLACVITPTTKTPKCDISNIVIPGIYTLLVRFNYTSGCAPGGLGPCWAEGSRESEPFLYDWKGVPVPKPTGIKVGIP